MILNLYKIKIPSERHQRQQSQQSQRRQQENQGSNYRNHVFVIADVLNARLASPGTKLITREEEREWMDNHAVMSLEVGSFIKRTAST